uniref:Trypsin1like [Megachile rotundata] n=1 Tax=Lepeophtheirus salmonis TaxID=72036 RepID=A0A0K2V012_LEPSM
MNKVLFLLLQVTFSIWAFALPPVRRVEERIVNGGPTERGEIQYQLGLQGSDFNHPFCGATLIGERIAITAAHCVVGSGSDGFRQRRKAWHRLRMYSSVIASQF